jgi:eukaryotic-like serine/threonine-protein kinase
VAVQVNGSLLAERYRVIRRLGSGGAATVFLCEDERLGRKVAVKRMHADSPDDIARRLRREARLGASLSHPGLVSVFDTETYDEGVFIVMEYVEGETLRDALSRGPLDTRRALEILGALASALDHVHAQGIVHRDVKPANVLLGKDGSVKLADLGVGIATDNTRITRSGQVLGTPAYMSPEQVEGAKPTPAVDIYALGAVAYEMFAGEKARKGSTPLEVAQRVVSEPAPDLRSAWPEAPPAAAEAIKWAMARDPANRPRSAGDFMSQISSAIRRPATAATTPLIDRTMAMGRPPLRRQRSTPAWLLPAALIAIVGIAALVIVLSTSGGGSSPKATANHSTTRHHKRHKAATNTAHRTSTQTTNTQAATTTPAATPPAATPPAVSAPPATSTNPSALNDRGKALIDAGRPADAIPVLQKALAAFPADQRSSLTYAYTLFNLGDAYLKSGQPDKAIPYLQQRLNWNDQRPVVEAELQQAMQQAGVAGAGTGPAKDKKGHGKG